MGGNCCFISDRWRRLCARGRVNGPWRRGAWKKEGKDLFFIFFYFTNFFFLYFLKDCMWVFPFYHWQCSHGIFYRRESSRDVVAASHQAAPGPGRYTFFFYIAPRIKEKKTVKKKEIWSSSLCARHKNHGRADGALPGHLSDWWNAANTSTV